jgi:hypothetical protein
METRTELQGDNQLTAGQIIMKIIGLAICLCFAVDRGASLHTNWIQNDDAWIPDAIMLLGIGIVAVGILLEKSIRLPCTHPGNSHKTGLVTFCGLTFTKLEKTPETSSEKTIAEPESISDRTCPDFALYKVSAIGLATFLGSMAAGGLLLSKNFKKLGKETEARNALIYSVIATIAVFIIGMNIPEDWNIPGIIFTIPQGLVMYHIAKHMQEKDINQHIENGGALASNWKAAGISILVFIGVMIVLFPVAMAFANN